MKIPGALEGGAGVGGDWYGALEVLLEGGRRAVEGGLGANLLPVCFWEVWSVEVVSLNFFLLLTGLTFSSQSIAAGTSSLPRAISGPCLPPPAMGGSRSVITRAGWLFMGFVICSNFRCNFFKVSILKPV